MNIKKIIFLSVAAGTLLQSCSKLDLTDTESIEPTKAFRNLDDVNMGVLGAYAPVDYTLIAAAAIVSDEIMYPTENTVSNSSAHQWAYNSSSGSVTSSFLEYYDIIDRTNRVLDAIPQIPVSGGSQTTMDQYKGELLALRAYCHFELLRAFASSYDPDAMGVPYVKHHELGAPARGSVKSNFDEINSDLIAAKALIPSSFTNNTRITKTAVSAIQARVALYEKNWANAITYATEAINSEPLAPKNDFGKIWKDSSNAEVIWQLARVPGDSRIGSAFFRETGSIVLYAPAFKLINLFNRADDIRFASYIKYDPARAAGSNGTKSAYLVNKYIGSNGANPGLTNIKLFRTGEMYLIRAEAALEANGTDLTSASKDLNDLRAARIYSYAGSPFTDKQSLLTAIYNERYKELAFEGHRFFDLKRRKWPVERAPEDAINASGAVKLDPGAAQYSFPIPFTEMSVNKNMKQNPGYSDK